MTVQILLGDCRQRLRELPDGSVHCCVTSPPYFGLRDYGHDGQIGLEASPAAFVGQMVDVFREVRRVLRDDGTLWLNLGDSYATNAGQGLGGGPPSPTSTLQGNGHQGGGPKLAKLPNSRRGRSGNLGNGGVNGAAIPDIRVRPDGCIKNKDLLGIPWRVAFALQDDGWYLRQDIIWAKPNPMPESVRDRCTKAHEYLFLLSKSPRYYFDSEAIAETRTSDEDAATFRGGCYVAGDIDNGSMGKRQVVGNRKNSFARTGKLSDGDFGQKPQFRPDREPVDYSGRRNKRSVWTVATQPFKEAHFATYPPGLIEPCILAGCPGGGVVLDPFGGAGTTGLVAARLQRSAVLIELNPEYAALAERRLASDGGLFADVGLVA